jgi:hypothetical protein
MADDEPQFLYFTDELGITRQVRPEDVDQVPDTWTPEDKPKPKAATKKSS